MILGVPCYYEKLLKDLGLKAFTPETLDGWLAGHVEPFVPFLGLKESRPLFLAMVKGLLGGLPRKTVELIADNYLGPRLGPLMNYFMSEAQWDDHGMLEAYRNALPMKSPNRAACSPSTSATSTRPGTHSSGWTANTGERAENWRTPKPPCSCRMSA